MPRTGTPQWLNVSLGPAASGGGVYAGTVGSADEVDRFFTSSSGGSTGLFSEAAASHTITSGPQSTGPVIVIVNGVVYDLPFNTGTQFPPHVNAVLGNASQAGWVTT